MAILRELALAQAGSESGRATLECGCFVGQRKFSPCPWHRREFADDMKALTEDEVDCREACCDPA